MKPDSRNASCWTCFFFAGAPPVNCTRWSSRQYVRNCSLRFIRHDPSTYPRVTHCKPPQARFQAAPSNPSTDLPHAASFFHTLWRFSRPHTIYGTALSIISVHVLAVRLAPLCLPGILPSLLSALIPALAANLYIVGLNQLHDVHLDRVNKPMLPLAAGALSLRAGRRIIRIALICALIGCVSPWSTSALRVTLLGSLALGAAYSAPPLRLKRFAAIASGCILVVRGLLVNIGFFLHAVPNTTLNGLPIVVKFASAFFVLFGVVIALLKDVPDVPGDRRFGIRTFSVRAGPDVVFRLGVGMLCVMFFGAGLFFMRMATSTHAVLAAAAHFAVAAALVSRARHVNAENREEATRYYMMTWKAFYLEYLLLPLCV